MTRVSLQPTYHCVQVAVRLLSLAQWPLRGGLSDASSPKADRLRGASWGTGCGGRAHQKGVACGVRHAFSFDLPQLVIQQVIPSYFFIEAPMEQLPLRLLCRLDAPAVVPPEEVAKCVSYREAVKLCWKLRRVRNMTKRQLAADAGLYPPHVTCYIEDGRPKKSKPRNLPGHAVRGFEWACGNTAISQWHSLQAKLTVLEELQATKVAA